MDIERARELAEASLANLELHRQRIDDLNVYPVPDGDTGTNLTLTERAVVEQLRSSDATGPEAVARELSRAALMGARGNSGVIFSQIVRGFADVLADHEEIDGPVLARAFRSASDAAYRAVRRPVEGTMLTVIREMAEEAERPEVAALPKAELLERVVERGEEALARTPQMLPVLAEAGVVDAGGAGLVEIVRGLWHGVTGAPLPEVAVEAAPLSLDAIHRELSEYRYCTVFVIEGEGLDAEAVERELEALGDSLLVVGDASALKVHVHTDVPGTALAVGTRVGTIEGVEVANMHRQTAEREDRLQEGGAPALPGEAPVGLIAIAPGGGNRMVFESYGAARVVEGGQTMNPSTAEIVEAIEAVPAQEVLVLPNNSNVILTAEQAAQIVGKRVTVIPTRSVPEGLAAAVAFMPSQAAEENLRAMQEAVQAVATGEVTTASRDTVIDGVDVRRGQWLGLVNGDAVACDADFERVVESVLDRILSDGRHLLTLITGDDAPVIDPLLAKVAERHPDVEVEVYEGGQPHYPLLLSAE